MWRIMVGVDYCGKEIFWFFEGLGENYSQIDLIKKKFLKKICHSLTTYFKKNFIPHSSKKLKLNHFKDFLLPWKTLIKLTKIDSSSFALFNFLLCKLKEETFPLHPFTLHFLLPKSCNWKITENCIFSSEQ